jgi:hypothetical protein
MQIYFLSLPRLSILAAAAESYWEELFHVIFPQLAPSTSAALRRTIHQGSEERGWRGALRRSARALFQCHAGGGKDLAVIET